MKGRHSHTWKRKVLQDSKDQQGLHLSIIETLA
jgi:hypothetical protein